jgi:LmbE family N-acetylglucosaminyl deacetylase
MTTTVQAYDSIPESALVVAAHPDDIEFMAAGTVARWTGTGSMVVYCLVTDGDKGSSDPALSRFTLAATRRAEQQAAARAVGVEIVEFLHYEDGMVEPTLALRRDIARVIRRHKPQAVICMDPTRFWSGRGYINHPDHRAVAEATLAAIYPSARDPLTFPELLSAGYEPHKVREIFVGFTEHDDTIVDISATVEAKVAALLAHRSQMGEWNPAETMDKWAREAAEGQPFSHGERFRYFNLDQEE